MAAVSLVSFFGRGGLFTSKGVGVLGYIVWCRGMLWGRPRGSMWPAWLGSRFDLDVFRKTFDIYRGAVCAAAPSYMMAAAGCVMIYYRLVGITHDAG